MIRIISCSPFKLWPNGKNVGMPSFFNFHDTISNKNDVNLTYVYIGAMEPDCDEVRTKFTYVYKRISLLKSQSIFIKPIFKIINLFYWVWMLILTVKPVIIEAKKKNEKVLLYGHTAYGAVGASILGKIFRLPNVSRLYGSLLPYKLGVSDDYPVPLKNQLINKLTYFEEYLAFRMPASHYVLTNDGSLSLKLFKQVNKSSNYSYLINGVDCLPCISQNDLDINFKNEGPLLLCSGRLINWKRIDRSLLLLDKLHEKGLKCNLIITCVIGTDGIEQYNKILELIELFNLHEYVKIFEAVPREQLSFLYKNVDFVLMLQDFLNLSNVLLESLFYRCNTLSINVGNVDDIICNNVNGYLVPLSSWLDDSCSVIINHFNEKIDLTFEDCKLYSWKERVDMEYQIIRNIFK